MDCSEVTRLVGALLDGELDPETAETVSEHLAGCDECRAAFQSQSDWRRAIQQGAPRYRAPSSLRDRIAAGLASEAKESPRDESPARRSAARPSAIRRSTGRLAGDWRPWAMAASLLLAITTSSGITAYVTQRNDNPVADEIVASHVRSLMAEHLTDVASTDQHTVKPWFHGRLDFAPPVEDLAADGFPLVGGRLDYLEERPVAALVYRHRQHPINLFILPAEGRAETPADTQSRRGYTLLHWQEGALSYWAVSDLNATEMKEFETLLEKRSHPS